jgi:outer membrane lipoprotein SlyB
MSGRLRKRQKHRDAVSWRVAFTFARAVPRPFAGALALALALSACAPTTRPSPTASAPELPGGPAGPAYGTIDAVRPIAMSAGATGNDPKAQILTAMGVAAPGAPDATASEIVVQTDDGQTLSVIQANPAGLAPGERVEIVPGAMPRLQPLAAAAPAAKS